MRRCFALAAALTAIVLVIGPAQPAAARGPCYTLYVGPPDDPMSITVCPLD